MSLAGVCIVSLASGIGEISYLALTSHYPPMVVAAWSSGTGGAGLLGSLAYAFLTEKSMANLTPKDAVLLQLFIPIVFGLTYFCVLIVPKDIYPQKLHPKSSIVSAKPIDIVRKCDSFNWDEENEKSEIQIKSTKLWIPQRTMSFLEKLKLIPVRI
ncbi:CLN3 protein [Dictyocaulus viviparus]|uniref:Battenin n=1 Tax=Dictyocaulus viviparus TaxID=29172 RepID=A0A0D8XGN5_DICVI|nr:CLN3 protein [Dictyocaulus viviparus]